MSYSLVDHRPSVPRVDDEAILNLSGQIDAISGSRSVQVGSGIDVSLCCSKSYPRDERELDAALPMFSITLKKGVCSALFYLPSEVFWGLRPMLFDGQLTSLTVTFGPIRYGSAEVVSIDFGSLEKLGQP